MKAILDAEACKKEMRGILKNGCYLGRVHSQIPSFRTGD
jgi:hypothetical protein